MSFDALLNKICTIQVLTNTQAASGQLVESWATSVSNVKCRLEAVGGSLQINPNMVYANTTHILYLRNPSTITLDVGTYRILLDGVTYMILLVKFMFEFTSLSHLEVLLEVVK